MQSKLQIFTARSGRPSAKVLFDDGSFRHIHSTISPETESELFPPVKLWGDTLLFIGCGLGYHIRWLTKEQCAVKKIIIVDYFNECAEYCIETIFKAIGVKPAILSADVNADDRKKMLAVLYTEIKGSVQIIRQPASYDIHREFYRSIENVLTAKPCVPLKTLRRIMLFGGNFFLQQELETACRTIGLQPIIFDPGREHSSTGYFEQLQRCIQLEKPDLAISVNMKGFDGDGILAEYTASQGIPLVCWFVDDPRPMLLHHKRYIQSNMIALCWERSYLPWLRTLLFCKVDYLPLGADPTIFKSAGANAAPSVELGFVGTSMGGSFLRDIMAKFMWDPMLAPLVEIAADLVCAAPDSPVDMAITNAAIKCNIVFPFTDEFNNTWFASLVIHTASMKKRRKLAQTLAQRNLTIFGDPDDWREVLGDLPVALKPSVDYRHQLCALYQRICIQVNSTSCQMPTAVNQRVFDVPLASGFLLSDDQSDMPELFDVGKEAVVYGDMNELVDKINFYNQNSNSRNAITAAATKRILSCHTYIHRLKTIISLI